MTWNIVCPFVLYHVINEFDMPAKTPIKWGTQIHKNMKLQIENMTFKIGGLIYSFSLLFFFFL